MEYLNYVKVTLTLKNSQYDKLNNWFVTLNGEKRIVTSQQVVFHSLTFEEAVKTFNIEECLKVDINWVDNNYEQEKYYGKVR